MMPWELSELTSKQKALLYALIDIHLEKTKNMKKTKK